ncbi:SAM-dependent methyltransferase [Streptomyces caatingaensis]|uniref:Methyltransferase n=1 Tax=Streptomyces caatingaensis TaxID=1678637 RepID=A0A0K9XCB1_9ACTN|nr:methyltransferase domain-containing protein [Streptomyces caatingaensis]KNB50838.1 methyltransferase [Streptomyces caatingaensis]
MRTRPNPGTVARYYDAMTPKLLGKYGAGPRVHYHMGFYASRTCPDHPDGTPPDTIRASMNRHQELLLRKTAEVWDAPTRFSGAVLDVGCGLGGPAIWWAQRYGADVTCVTIAPGHPPIIEQLAERAGVRDRIEVLLCEAERVPAGRLYDTAVAIESADYFDRSRWFQRLAGLVRPGGSVCVEDVFTREPRGAPVWSDYFYARPGSVEEFTEAARAAGFRLADLVDVTEETAPFWTESAAWTRAVLDGPGSERLDCEERRRLRISLHMHRALHEEWRSGSMREAILRFERTGV